MTHGERTLSGIAEELERLGDIHALFQGDGPTTTALREAATLIRTADDREKVLREALERIASDTYKFGQRVQAFKAIARQALGGTNAK